MSAMPEQKLKTSFFLVLYLPWIIAIALQAAPATSFLVAWCGSFFIFYHTWLSRSRFILHDLPAYRQIMRPIFLQQLVFAGFMCCTSVFFFMNTLGFKYFDQISKVDFISLNETLTLTAKCQRMSVLAHAAFVTGVLINQSGYTLRTALYKPASSISIETWILRVGLVTFGLSLVFESISGLFQFSIGFYNIAVICGAVILAKGITLKNERLLAWGGFIFISNVLNASLSGYKEPVIVNFIILGALLFPSYRKQVTIIAIPFFIALFYIAPTYSGVIRSQSWSGEVSAEEARTNALETLLQEEETPIEETNWNFMTGRLSEIGMFTQFARTTPDPIPYYQLDILKNSLEALIPRALWDDKPITEEIAMKRVYDAGVVDSRSSVSAKSRPVVDGYLSGGVIGVFIYMLCFGLISQALSNKAERLFGGYEIGCVIFFNGFFQILWRGETTEFMVNSVFYSFIAMGFLFLLLRLTNYLERVQPE